MLLSKWLLSASRRNLLKQSANAGGLNGAGHAAAAFDGVADAPDFGVVAFGDGGLERVDAPVEIGDDGGINLAYGEFGHHAAELGEGFEN